MDMLWTFLAGFTCGTVVVWVIALCVAAGREAPTKDDDLDGWGVR